MTGSTATTLSCHCPRPAIKPMAYNQGFYNLFLGIGAVVGLGLHFGGLPEAGLALVLFTTASMVLAMLARH
ncbi:DUF1304 family protein [Cryobacterium sp. TMT1-2-2]|uniref:DUF1304 family protein n=1 Tax=Cryobacterium sp. TMT1-2-2 TaxID=1259233 RepID=UPI001F53FD7C|nr:DUF1304 family protein [Cryobacterium sp. TMT1-2-2]